VNVCNDVLSIVWYVEQYQCIFFITLNDDVLIN